MVELSYTPIFIGACPRSGTTFLGDRLGALTGGRVTPEAQFKSSVLHALEADDPAGAVAHLESDWVYRMWQERPQKAALLAAGTAAEFFEKLVFPNGVESADAPFWIDHTPINFNDLVPLRAAFPNARFVNLVRDGRAVFASVRKLTWGPNNPIDAAIWWQSRVAPGLAASLLMPEHCITVRYEDLVRGDLCEWTRLMQFVTSDASRTVSAQELESQSKFDLPDFTRYQHELVGGKLVAGRAEAWRREAPARLIEIFEANAGALMDSLGYERVTLFPRQASRGERIRMGEWPVRIRTKPINRVIQTLRKRRINSGTWK